MRITNSAEVMIKSGAAALVAMAGAAKAQDLRGLYGGLSYDRGTGDIAYDDGLYTFEGNGAGAFVGYNHVMGDWLIGAELAFSSGGYAVPEPSLSPSIDVGRVIDIKARAGRVFGQTLVYGVIGGSSADLRIESPATAEGRATGLALGLGVETSIGGKGFVGLEYLARDLDFDFDNAPAADEGATLDTITLRVGLRF